jgi:SAM-dependent methyltransferase
VVKAKSANWFEDWFNTKYYHDLYRHRDDSEAFDFVHALKNSFQWKANDTVLDVCCGNGRHALNLEKMGMVTWGVDLSDDNIAMAKANSNFPDRWQVQDARSLHLPNRFDVVLNLFTSFGYFEDDKEHEMMLDNIRQFLHPDGSFVLDFFNLDFVRSFMVHNEVQEGVLANYHITRNIDSNWVRKEICFEVDGERMVFEEKVRALSAAEIQQMLERVGFQVIAHLGDYQLSPFQANSPRSIFICKLQKVC